MPTNNKPKVSVCIPTYNHERYIEDALCGALKQKTNFQFEIVIGDDASTDTTQKIIKKFQKKYPKLIRLNLQKKNQGIVKNWLSTLWLCDGEYIAILEGDDMWTDAKKLQKQIDFLDNNSDFSISSHNVLIKYEGENVESIEWLGKNHRKVATIQDILREGSGGATCSLVFRKSALLNNLPSWFKSLPGCDWPTQIVCTASGKMRYFPEVMGIYRRSKTGATAFKAGSKQELDAFLGGGINYCQLFNKHFNYKYDKEIKENLGQYFYPALINIYKYRHDPGNARKYAFKALLGRVPSSLMKPKNWTNLISTFVIG